MTDVLLGAGLLLLLVLVVLQVAALARGGGRRMEQVHARMDALDKGQERGERTVREEMGRSRQEAAALLKGIGDSVVLAVGELGVQQRSQLEGLRVVVDERLRQIQQDNAAKLELMRQVVEEKLQGTLEKRLGESFRQVSDRLEQVHRGLGQMQQLASGVGDLKRVLANVKTRGTWGEIQLGAILEQMLSPQQYERNVATRNGAAERVEFAVRLPGRDEPSDVVWLPVDSKFPMDKYQSLLDAQEQADPEVIEKAARGLEAAVKLEARRIQQKYLDPPRTTDFAIMFLPGEGLYAEVLRRPGLAEELQARFRVTVTGPTTLGAFLSALQLGFRTLAIEQRAGEVWKLLGAVKTDFGKFGGILGALKKKLDEAASKVDAAAYRSRQIEKKLHAVEALPEGGARQMLLGEEPPVPEVAVPARE